jgi:hypothetical protein
LKHYVYLLVNPLDGRVFYVGKGKGGRAWSHLKDSAKTEKGKIIKNIRKRGLETQIQILAHGLDTTTARRIETAAIDVLGISNLANEVRGWKGGELGRMPIEKLITFYQRKPLKVKEPALLIRISRLYRYGMSEAELYDATRGVWKIGRQREKVRFAMAVHEDIVREVYEITQWLPAGSTFTTRSPRGERMRGRWEFAGRVAEDSIRRKCIDRYVGRYFKPGARNPITYVHVD